MDTSPTLHDLLKGRFAIVRKDLDEIISRLADTDLDWAPGPGMRTVRGQLIEIAATERQILTWVRDHRQMPIEEAETFESDTTTLAGLGDALSKVRTDTLAYIDGQSQDELQALQSFPPGWWEALGLAEVPKSEALRSIAAHEWYHTGQLVSYLWARGDNPYSWPKKASG